MKTKNIKISTLLLLLGLFFYALPTNSYAQGIPNVCQITNPAAGAVVLEWLADRTVSAAQASAGCPQGTRRDHLGVDIMLDTCVPVVNQQGCYIVMNGNSPIWGSNGSGYGYYMRYTCNADVEVRFTHIHGYDADAQRVLNGYSGAAVASAPHIHYEVYARDSTGTPRAVDPECVWGDLDAATCCRGVTGPCLLGNGPADMCNSTVLQQLSQNHDARQVGGSCNSPSNGYTSKSITPGVEPFAVPSGQHIPPDVPPCDGTLPPAPPGPPSPPGTVLDNEGSPTNTTVTPTYPGGTVTFPPDPAGTEPSGTPGGNADLTPSSPSTGASGSTCAADTWISMVNQAVLEARRETIVNQRLIAKADSVLTYSCFDELVNRTGLHAGPIFSETNLWQGRSIDIVGDTVTVNVSMGSSSLDGSLTNTVNLAAAAYLTSDFNHGLLGETAAVGAPLGGCGIMNAVWQAAKCQNFNTPFYTFDYLLSNDPREYPASMTCGASVAVPVGP